MSIQKNILRNILENKRPVTKLNKRFFPNSIQDSEDQIDKIQYR